MKHLEDLLELVDKEIKSVADNGKFRSREEVDSVYKLVDIAKDIYCIWQYESESEDDEYSEGGYPMRYGMTYDGGGSYAYARGRGRNARRDSRGRYSRDGGNMPSYDGYSSYRGGRGGYSRDGGNEEYLEELRRVMDSAPDENTRQSIQRMISQMER